jgi:hypothetical protein
MQLAINAPVRTIGISRRALTGRLASGDGQTKAFESSLERDWLMVLDFLPNVSDVRVQPFTIKYPLDGAERKYTPDVQANHTLADGRVVTHVYEVKFRDDLKLEWKTFRPRFKAMVAYCRARQWRFGIVTEREIRTALLDNARFLRRYRAMETNVLMRRQLLYTFKAIGACTPQSLMAAAYWADDARAAAIPQLWKLVIEGLVGFDHHSRLTMASSIWMQDHA